ncbi:hypothetical protein [Azospirillum doebereinerae]
MNGQKSDDRVDVEALEDTMDEVLETLAVAEQAAAFVEANSAGDADRSRAGAIRRQAEAMLDAADEAVSGEGLFGEDLLGEDRDPPFEDPSSPAAQPTGLLH